MFKHVAHPTLVRWGRVLNGGRGQEVRVFERLLQRHRAAELAADLVHLFAGPGAVRPNPELYLVDQDTQKISWESFSREFWVVVEAKGE